MSEFGYLENQTEASGEERLCLAQDRMFTRNLEWSAKDIRRSGDNAARYIMAAVRSDMEMSHADALMNDAETACREALLAILLAKRAYHQRFTTPVAQAAE